MSEFLYPFALREALNWVPFVTVTFFFKTNEKQICKCSSVNATALTGPVHWEGNYKGHAVCWQSLIFLFLNGTSKKQERPSLINCLNCREFLKSKLTLLQTMPLVSPRGPQTFLSIWRIYPPESSSVCPVLHLRTHQHCKPLCWEALTSTYYLQIFWGALSCWQRMEMVVSLAGTCSPCGRKDCILPRPQHNPSVGFQLDT